MKISLLVALAGVTLYAAGLGQSKQQDGPGRPLTGNLHWDLTVDRTLLQDTLSQALVVEEHKHPFTAALLSAVVPGAGEFYAKSYWRAGLFVAAEAVLWVVYATRTSKGDALTDEFQRYADTHWSVVAYAQWMQTNESILNPDAPPCSGIVTNSDPSVPPWERVDWNLLNQCESDIGAKASTGFSHRLPRRPDQQYYELIGKYLQYNAGWDDWGGSGPSTSEYLAGPSPRFAAYSGMRGRANDSYNIASTATFILVANHILSAFDAAWATSQYNAGIKMRAHLEPAIREYGLVEFVPTATLTLEF